MISIKTLEQSFREMLRIRLFEERVRREFGKGDMPGFVHVYVGAEAIAVAVCSQLEKTDLITSTHRGHGHCLAKGVEVAPMVAELYGRESGLCHGRGGSMHIADFSKGVLGANAIVGGGIGLAVGAALAAQTLKDGRIAVTFFGDGASNQGVLHESMNLASIWKLPVVFVCENNGWAESTPASYSISVSDIATRAAGYSIPGVVVDATDYGAMPQSKQFQEPELEMVRHLLKQSSLVRLVTMLVMERHIETVMSVKTLEILTSSRKLVLFLSLKASM